MILRRIGQLIGGLAVLAVVALLIGYTMSDSGCDAATGGGGERMQAIIYCEYGTADVLRFADVTRPVADDDEVLVKVHAAALNPLDWHYMRGTPYLIRLVSGLRKPTTPAMGIDFAGTVEAVGRNVTRFKPGDEVFGGRDGAFGDYVTVHQERAVVLKPANLTFEQAAAVPIAAITALQALRDKAELKPGQKVLVNGASGGVGTFAVQIAKAWGAEVTGVSSTRNLELVRSLGADHVIDYTRENFTEGTERYDLIFDCVGNHPLLALKRALTTNGTAVMIGGGGPDAGRWIEPLVGEVKNPLLSAVASQKFISLLAELNQADLQLLAGLLQSGTVTPVIDRSYPLSEAAQAIRYLETGRARGKVVLTVDQ